MKSKKKMNITLGMILGIIFFLSIRVNNNLNITGDNSLDNLNLKLSKVSGKIHINGNSDWLAFKNAGNCSGSGTASDPYVLEDLVIDGGSVGSCILIENSDVYFMILNCTLTNSGGLINADHDGGIKFLNVSNGHIFNSTLSNNNYGFYCDVSQNVAIIGNLIENRYGVKLLYSNDSLAYFNDFKNSDINLFFQETTLRFYSEQKMIYRYDGNTYENYIGNYWSNYIADWLGSDNNGDGIGEIPIISLDIDGQMIDNCPLFEPIENYEIIGFASEDAIPGYDILLLLCVCSIVSILIIKKQRFN
jgi:hypothetical protein